MGKHQNIAVSEVSAEPVSQVCVTRSADQLVIVVNGQPFTLDVNRASSLAWDLCRQIDALRSEEFQRAA